MVFPRGGGTLPALVHVCQCPFAVPMSSVRPGLLPSVLVHSNV